MPVFLRASSRIICQGVQTEKHLFDVHQSLAYGTKILAFVQPGKGGSAMAKLPVYNSVQEACLQTAANMTIIYSEGRVACNDIVEAIYANVSSIVVLSQTLPLHDFVAVSQILRAHPSCTLLGPGIFGIITPRQAKIGPIPGFVFSPGAVGCIASTDSLAYAISYHMTNEGIGQSTFVGMYGEAFRPCTLMNVAAAMNEDEQTSVLLYIADASKDKVEEMIDFQNTQLKKPMVVVAPGAKLSPKITPHVAIVRDLTQVSSVIKEYVKKELP